MRNIFSGGRLFAAAAASIAFVATFAVSARAVMRDPAGKLIYVIVSVDANATYEIGQKIEVPADPNAEQYVEIDDGVWAELVEESRGF
jgi:hypothetical protein